MRKKIFITTQYMALGGVERSLIGLLDAIDYTKYEVDLFIQHHTGEMMDDINSHVNLLPEISEYSSITKPLSYSLKKGFYSLIMGRLKAKFICKFGSKSDKPNASVFQYIADYTTKHLPSITNKIYDVAISFHHPHDIVIEKINALKKIAWIHTDYSQIYVNAHRELPKWSRFDYIVSISNSSRDAFISTFPQLDKKVLVIENILSPSAIRSKKNLIKTCLDDSFSLLTVGRFCYPKAFDRAVRLCYGLRKKGLPIKWYAIGYGDITSVQSEINRLNMSDHFIILGKEANPYPYMQACVAYIQPSRYEGKSVAVREAQILAKPVVITDYPSAKDQVRHGYDGMIISMDEEKAVNELYQILSDEALLLQLSENCLNSDFGNEYEINKLYQLI